MTNDLISRKALLEAINTYDEKYELQKLDVFDLINSAPAIQQCGDGEPVAWIVTSEMNDGAKLEWVTQDKKHYKEHCDFGKPIPLYLAPPDQTAKINELEIKISVLNEKLEYVKSRLDVANEIIKDNEKLEVYRRRYHQLVDGEGCHFAETDDNWYDIALMNKTLDNEALSEDK